MYSIKLQSKLVEFAFSKLDEVPVSNKSRHISVLTYKNIILEYATNKEYGSYTRSFGYTSLHSEYNCIRKFLKKNTLRELAAGTLWNVRIDRYNALVNAKPCEKCQHMLLWWTPRATIYWDNQKFVQFIS